MFFTYPGPILINNKLKSLLYGMKENAFIPFYILIIIENRSIFCYNFIDLYVKEINDGTSN